MSFFSIVRRFNSVILISVIDQSSCLNAPNSLDYPKVKARIGAALCNQRMNARARHSAASSVVAAHRCWKSFAMQPANILCKRGQGDGGEASIQYLRRFRHSVVQRAIDCYLDETARAFFR